MLTRRQLQSISAKAGVPMQTIERDYIQTVFLYELYKQSNNFFFKGGTCLRMGYKLNRYSEDLDFNYNDHPEDGVKVLNSASARLNDFGIESKIKKADISLSGFTTKLRYKGPLYNGAERSLGAVTIDVSCRKEHVKTTTQTYHPVYDDCPSFVMRCLTLDHLFAEKIRALLIRNKPRDLYDVWFISATAAFDRMLINEKLKLYNLSIADIDIDHVFSSIEKDWKQDLQPLLGFVPDFHEIKLIVGNKLHELQH
ncbi:MAG: nucleotidyl transferase AbiEii/AbiGii toxin family protein [Euryarchaeota archaeon]|nr:nucleotidyl transferase AbiEii/AbiGii toxin family protein [Euryarchaeota archaeon]